MFARRIGWSLSIVSTSEQKASTSQAPASQAPESQATASESPSSKALASAVPSAPAGEAPASEAPAAPAGEALPAGETLAGAALASEGPPLGETVVAAIEPKKSEPRKLLEFQVEGIKRPEAMQIFLDYVYTVGAGATCRYEPGSSEVNADVLSLSARFDVAFLHEEATRWLAKGLTTENVVGRLVLCEEFKLGRLRQKILEHLTASPPALAAVARSEEIRKHPHLLQELLLQVAGFCGARAAPVAEEVGVEVEAEVGEETAAAPQVKAETVEKSDKIEKVEKADKSEKVEKTADVKHETVVKVEPGAEKGAEKLAKERPLTGIAAYTAAKKQRSSTQLVEKEKTGVAKKARRGAA